MDTARARDHLLPDYLQVIGSDLIYPCHVTEGDFGTSAIVRDWLPEWKPGTVTLIWDNRQWGVEQIYPDYIYDGQSKLLLTRIPLPPN